MSFRDSFGMRRIPGRIVQDKKERYSADKIAMLISLYVSGVLTGAVGCLMIWGFSK